MEQVKINSVKLDLVDGVIRVAIEYDNGKAKYEKEVFVEGYGANICGAC